MDDESSIPSKLREVESLRNLASMVKFRGGNTLLHQFVLDHSHPNKAASNSFLNAVLLSMHNVPGHVANALNDEYCTALHVAVRKNNLPMVRKLLSCVAHIDVNARSGWYETLSLQGTPYMYGEYGALHFAVKNGNTCIARELLHGGANVHLLNALGKMPLCVAAEAGCLDVVKLLANEGANVNLGLHSAARSGHLEAVKFLVSSGADVNFKMCDTPLCYASKNGHLAVVEYLVSEGADVNIAGCFGWIPLHSAAYIGHLKIVEYLVENGSDVSVRSIVGRTPLFEATHCSSLEVIEYLLRNGADVNARDEYGETPLHTASRKGKPENVAYLLDHGADIHARDKDGKTPLRCAVPSCRTMTVELLISRGANINAQDGHNDTPLHYAVKKRNERILLFLQYNDVWKRHDAVGQANFGIVKSLLDRGSNLLAIGKEGEILVPCATHEQISKMLAFVFEKGGGWNPRDEDMFWYWSKVIRMLLDRGADARVRNENGETPLDLARNQQCINILEQNIV